jgi:hypothetical protein
MPKKQIILNYLIYLLLLINVGNHNYIPLYLNLKPANWTMRVIKISGI